MKMSRAYNSTFLFLYAQLDTDLDKVATITNVGEDK